MLRIEKLTVNHLFEAVGMDEAPRFSWRTLADGRSFVQQRYRLQIARNIGFCDPACDSGWVETDRSLNVEAAGFAMQSAREYFARVAVAGSGEESGWSEPLRFVSGLMDMPWQAKYVSAENPPCPESSKGTCVCGAFDVDGEVVEAWLFSTAKGIYVPWLNGSRVGEDLLSPGWTSYHRHALYQTNDVKSQLRQGRNVLGAMLGAGWYKGLMGFLSLRNNYGDQTAFLCQLLIRYADGREQLVVSDESWIGGDSPVTFSEIYDGERYDARLEREGWCTPEGMPMDWQAVSVVDGDFSVLRAQPGCRVRCERKLPAQRILVTPEGERVVDFGQNLTGWPEFRIRGEAGYSYTLKCFETLDAQGNVYTANLRLAKQELHYTCKGDGEEKHHPEFTFYGFRYVHLVDWPQDATAEDFCAWVVHSDMERTGEFECSEPLVNQLHKNILWGQRGNFLDVPTDCPQRNERVGWTGDAQIFCRTASCLMDVYAFYRKWLRDVRVDQQVDGGVSHVVPDIISGKPEAINDWLLGQGTHSAAGWADAIVICPWTLYLAYGDKQILEENYGSMRKWIDFMRDHAVDNIWKLVNNVPPKDRDIAMVFQSYALYPHMTVYNNMAFGLKLRKMPKDEIDRRVKEAAKILGIESYLNRKPAALSGGQRQRVALGRAIVREPKVFLMDEPLSNLDAKLRVQTRSEITKLHQRLQTTFIYVTHDQTEAMTMGSRNVVMKDGFMQQQDTPQNLYDYPANLFVGCFIGTPQMNVFEVELQKRGDGVYAVFGDNAIKVPAGKIQRMTGDYIGKKVYMGIRPENIHDEPAFTAAYPDACIRAHVELTELMGSETYLYLSTGGREGNFVARVDPRTNSCSGDDVTVGFDVNRLHFFDLETEKTILSRD